MNIQTHNSVLLVDLAVLRENARTILQSLEGAQLIPVLKDDAYGLGAARVAAELCRFPEIRCMAVAHVSEGLALREAGIDREILVMGGARGRKKGQAPAEDRHGAPPHRHRAGGACGLDRGIPRGGGCARAHGRLLPLLRRGRRE